MLLRLPSSTAVRSLRLQASFCQLCRTVTVLSHSVGVITVTDYYPRGMIRAITSANSAAEWIWWLALDAEHIADYRMLRHAAAITPLEGPLLGFESALDC